MKKSTLVITKRVGSIPIQGKCSSCLEVEFSTEGKVGTAAEHLNALNQEFKLHFADVHVQSTGVEEPSSFRRPVSPFGRKRRRGP